MIPPKPYFLENQPEEKVKPKKPYLWWLHPLTLITGAAAALAINYYVGGEPFRRGSHNESLVGAFFLIQIFIQGGVVLFNSIRREL